MRCSDFAPRELQKRGSKLNSTADTINTGPDWIIRPCAICGSRSYRSDARYPKAPSESEVRLCHCTDCGLETFQPQPSEDILPTFYGAEYYDEGYLQLQHKRLPLVRKAVTGRLGRYFIRGARALDVGAGPGFWMQAIAETGCDVEGFESSEAARRLLCDRGFRVHARWEDTPTDADVVLLADVLGHVPEPAHLLNRIHSRLKPGGHLIVRTPYYDGAWRRFETARALRVGQPIPGFPTILWRFQPEPFAQWLESNRFRVISTSFEIQPWAAYGSRKRKATRWLCALADFCRGKGDEFYTIAQTQRG